MCLDEICNPIDPFHSSSSRNSKSKIQFYIQKILTSHILAICNNLSTYIIWLRVFVASHAQTSYIFNDETHRIHFHKLQRTNQLPTFATLFPTISDQFHFEFQRLFRYFLPVFLAILLNLQKGGIYWKHYGNLKWVFLLLLLCCSAFLNESQLFLKHKGIIYNNTFLCICWFYIVVDFEIKYWQLC